MFGHRISAIATRDPVKGEPDLPLDLTISKVSHGEGTIAMEQAISLHRAAPDLLGRVLTADSGYSNAETYQLCDILGVTPVIAPTKKQRRHGIQLTDGVPRCESGQLMTLHFQSANRGACFRCPARRALRGGGFTFERERCLAETPCDKERSVGPTRYVKPGTASLAKPKFSYDSAEFKRLYKQRPAVERIFSVLKSPCRLIRTRRAAVLQALVVFQGISIHVNAWMRQDQRAAAPPPQSG